MKRKVKRYDGGGFGRFVEEPSTASAPPDLDTMKSKIAAGAPAADDSDTYAPKTRTFSTTGPEKPKPRPKPKVSAEDSAKNYAKLEAEEKNFRPASEVMKGGQAGERPTQRMTNAPLDKLKADRKAAAFNAERKAAAEERKKTARSTTSAVPYDSVNPNQFKMFEKDSYKKGGMAKSASARADGIAQRGKTRA